MTWKDNVVVNCRARQLDTVAAVIFCSAALAPLCASAEAQVVGQASNPLGGPILMVTLIDNPRVLVERWTLQPGERTDAPGKTHTDSHDVVVVQLTPGEIYMNTGESSETGHQDAGKIWWLATPHPHSLANVGKEPFDLVIIILKEPTAAGATPQAPTPAAVKPAVVANYMHRVVELENDRVIVALETMDIGQRTDPPGRVHPDPRDGVFIMMTPGNIEFNTGEKIEIGHQEIGKTWWMPKPPFLHSVANYGYTPNDPGGPFTFLLVSLK